jgi:hypothetical protein
MSQSSDAIQALRDALNVGDPNRNLASGQIMKIIEDSLKGTRYMPMVMEMAQTGFRKQFCWAIYERDYGFVGYGSNFNSVAHASPGTQLVYQGIVELSAMMFIKHGDNLYRAATDMVTKIHDQIITAAFMATANRLMKLENPNPGF